MTETSDHSDRPRRGTRASQRAWTYLALAAVTLVNVISHADVQRDAHTRLFGDALNSYRMSVQTGAPVQNPFALRMLSPWLVHRAHLLTGLSLDTLWLAFRGRLIAFTIVVVIGTINKETALLLAPLYPLLVWTRRRSLRDRHLLLAIAATAVTVVAYLGYRTWAEHLTGGSYGFGTGQANTSLLDNIRFALAAGKNTTQLSLFVTFHFFWLTFAYGLYRLYRQRGLRSELLTAGLWLFACCLAGRLLATDTDRVFIMMAPLVLAVTALIFDQHRGEKPRVWIGLLIAAYIAINLRWIPTPASLIVDALAGIGFALLIQTGQLSTWHRPPKPEGSRRTSTASTLEDTDIIPVITASAEPHPRGVDAKSNLDTSEGAQSNQNTHIAKA